MGSLSSEFGSFEGNFEPDEFYESFQAPKFHDFTAPEEPIDPDAFFKAEPGMASKKQAVVVEEVKALAPKIHKIATQDAPKTALMTTTGSQQQAPPKTPVAAEKAVSAGSVKKGIKGPVSTSLTPLTSKSLKNGNIACNSPSGTQHSMVEKQGSTSLKPMSLAKKLQASENDDPNSAVINNCSELTPSKAAKHSRKIPDDKPLTRSRSQKIIEPEDKPLSRSKSQKNLDSKHTPAEVETGSLPTGLVPLGGGTSNTEQESDVGKVTDKGTPQRKENSSRLNVANSVGVGALKALKVSALTAITSPTSKDHNSAVSVSVSIKTPVKESASNPQEVKKLIACTEAVGSPYSGHHCKSARCAANNPNYSSPVPTKKYLIARRGTPGSIRVATPNHTRAEMSSGDVPSEDSAQTSLQNTNTNEDQTLDGAQEGELEPVCNKNAKASERSEAKRVCTKLVFSDINADKEDGKLFEVQGRTQAALAHKFQNMALDQGRSNKEQQESKREPVTLEVTVVTISEQGEFKDVPLEESSTVNEPLQPISVEDASATSGCRVEGEERAASTSEGTTLNTESKMQGVDLFLKVASDCLENIDMDKLEVPQSKIGRKRKSQEMLVDGGSKRANCALDESNKPHTKQMKLRKRVTSPRPFRLRTQERGVLKEIEFHKKMEEYMAAKEGFNSAFQGLAATEPKIPGKSLKPGHVFCAKRADPCDQDENDADTQAQKLALPNAQKAPLFDHPFQTT